MAQIIGIDQTNILGKTRKYSETFFFFILGHFILYSVTTEFVVL